MKVPRLEDRNRRLAEAMEDSRSECQRDALSRSWVYGDSLHRTDLGVDQSQNFGFGFRLFAVSELAQDGASAPWILNRPLLDNVSNAMLSVSRSYFRVEEIYAIFCPAQTGPYRYWPTTTSAEAAETAYGNAPPPNRA
jgi:hypothetical protein